MKPKKLTQREIRYKQRKYWDLFEWLIYRHDKDRGGKAWGWHNFAKRKYDKTGKLPYVVICIYNFPVIGKFSVNTGNHKWWWWVRYAKKMRPYSTGDRWVTTRGGRRKRKNKQRLCPNKQTRAIYKRELLKLKQLYASNDHNSLL